MKNIFAVYALFVRQMRVSDSNLFIIQIMFKYYEVSNRIQGPHTVSPASMQKGFIKRSRSKSFSNFVLRQKTNWVFLFIRSHVYAAREKSAVRFAPIWIFIRACDESPTRQRYAPQYRWRSLKCIDFCECLAVTHVSSGVFIEYLRSWNGAWKTAVEKCCSSDLCDPRFAYRAAPCSIGTKQVHMPNCVKNPIENANCWSHRSRTASFCWRTKRSPRYNWVWILLQFYSAHYSLLRMVFLCCAFVSASLHRALISQCRFLSPQWFKFWKSLCHLNFITHHFVWHFAVRTVSRLVQKLHDVLNPWT